MKKITSYYDDIESEYYIQKLVNKKIKKLLSPEEKIEEISLIYALDSNYQNELNDVIFHLALDSDLNKLSEEITELIQKNILFNTKTKILLRKDPTIYRYETIHKITFSLPDNDYLEEFEYNLYRGERLITPRDIDIITDEEGKITKIKKEFDGELITVYF